MIRRYIVILLGAGLMACSSSYISVSSETKDVSGEQTNNNIGTLIEPYRDSVNIQMNEVIAHADTNFTAQRKPSGNLNNWVADAVFVNQTKTVRMSEPIFCLLNSGGLRSTLNKGEITIGDIYKLMPFDNTIVWVKLPISSMADIHAYIVQKGGEPISNAVVTKDRVQVNGILERHTHIWVITSDYLLNGGDNMKFFEKKTEVMNTGKLLRDALIEEAKTQGTLMSDPINRMLF
jgi:2',3'-cyclic-nucleotide 2'-phosphodiesterase (5'-nucleotidase family)